MHIQIDAHLKLGASDCSTSRPYEAIFNDYFVLGMLWVTAARVGPHVAEGDFLKTALLE